MRRFLSLSLIFIMIAGVALGVSGCKRKNVAPITTDVTKVEKSNGVSTNGGVTVVHDGKIYFINGTQNPDGTNGSNNKISAIYSVDYDSATGIVEDAEFKRVTDKLAGFDFGSIRIFGDYLYFTTPGDGVNTNGTVLYNKTKFMRYDLKNGGLSTIYTTEKNSTNISLDYAYYPVGNSLYLMVAELEYIDSSSNETLGTLKSIKVDQESKVVYTISDVDMCVFSELDYQKDAVDADAFIFYTKAPEIGKNAGQNGPIVYRVSPNKNNSKELTDGSQDVELYCIRAGKLIYASEVKYQETAVDSSGQSAQKDDIIYAEKIDDETTQLSFSINKAVSYNGFANNSVIFNEEEDGSISLLYFDSTSSSVNYIKWSNGAIELDKQIATLSVESSETVNFVGLTTITETIVEDNTETEEDETETADVTYLVYMVGKSGSYKAYKLEFKRKTADGTVTFMQSAQSIKLSTSTFMEPTEMMCAEIVDGYLFAFVEDDDKNKVFLTQTDLKIKANSTENSKTIDVEAETDDVEAEADED